MMLTIVPGAPRRIMSATAACIRKNGALRLTAMCRSNSSSVVSSSVPRVVSPAELTSESIRPCLLDRRLHRRHGLGHVGDVGLHVAGLGTSGGQLGGDPLAASGVAPDEDNGGAFAGGGPGDAGTETLGAAADQDHLPREEFHISPSGGSRLGSVELPEYLNPACRTTASVNNHGQTVKNTSFTAALARRE